MPNMLAVLLLVLLLLRIANGVLQPAAMKSLSRPTTCAIKQIDETKLHVPPKDIDAVESQRLERIKAARRIKRSRSSHSHRSYSADSRQEEETSTCLPNCLRSQQRSDRDHLYRSRNDTSISDFPSPDSNPPSYEGAYQATEVQSRSWSSNTKSLPEDCQEIKEERTALLVDIGQQTHSGMIAWTVMMWMPSLYLNGV